MKRPKSRNIISAFGAETADWLAVRGVEDIEDVKGLSSIDDIARGAAIDSEVRDLSS